MQATLYYNKSDKRYIHKTLEELSTDSVEFVDDSSIIDPVLRMTVDSKGIIANYIKLHDFNRYYFINNVVVSKGCITLYCHVDVLMTYKDEIMNENVILDRQSELFDLYQHDNEYKLSSRTNVRTIKFSGGFSEGGANYILHICGKTSSSPENEEGGE